MVLYPLLVVVGYSSCLSLLWLHLLPTSYSSGGECFQLGHEWFDAF